MKGKCLCGEVKFLIEGTLPNLYQCHCSLCRKATGTSSNTATFVIKNNFKWLSGEKNITKYSHSSGFRSNFCSVCGSPVPNIINDTEIYCVPAGLFDAHSNSKIAAHLYTGSKANWDTICSEGEKYDERPDIEVLYKSLQSDP